MVVASGGGHHAWSINNTRVAFYIQGTKQGSWAEYVIVPAKNCTQLDEDITYE